MFTNFSTQSRGFANELRKFVPAEDAAAKDETKNTGKMYRVWMDFKAAVTSHDRKAILSSCEFGEDKAKQTYNEVIEHSDDIPSVALDIIMRQRAEIQKGHDIVKAMRDAIA